MTKKVALGMSGGVDSSASAKLLLEQGYEVTGFYLSGLYPGPKQDAAIADTKKVAAILGIDAHILDLGSQPDYLSKYFLETYRSGQTPNVCVVCNRQIKFGFFYDWALTHGFDFVATGHYARIKKLDNQYYLRTAFDKSKDQSYFMGLVDPALWARVIFPVGEFIKTDIRKKAAAWQIPVATKAESMEVCFLQNQKMQDFLRENISSYSGEIVTPDGQVIGRHRGLQFYTIGQRKGLQIQPTSDHTPIYYVKAKDFTANRLIVAPKTAVYQSHLDISQPTARLAHALEKTTDFSTWRVRIRHQGTLHPLKSFSSTGCTTGRLELAQPVFGVSPGQFAVFYRQDPDNSSDWLVIGAATLV